MYLSIDIVCMAVITKITTVETIAIITKNTHTHTSSERNEAKTI